MMYITYRTRAFQPDFEERELTMRVSGDSVRFENGNVFFNWMGQGMMVECEKVILIEYRDE